MNKEKKTDIIVCIVLFALVASLIIFIFVTKPSAGKNNYAEHAPNLISIGDNLYYDKNTKIVYFIFNEKHNYQGYGYMSPYYAPNGLPYIYDNDLMEISTNAVDD